MNEYVPLFTFFFGCIPRYFPASKDIYNPPAISDGINASLNPIEAQTEKNVIEVVTNPLMNSFSAKCSPSFIVRSPLLFRLVER